MHKMMTEIFSAGSEARGGGIRSEVTGWAGFQVEFINY